MRFLHLVSKHSFDVYGFDKIFYPYVVKVFLPRKFYLEVNAESSKKILRLTYFLLNDRYGL